MGHRCVNCRKIWAGDTGPEERFEYITKICPDCLARTPMLKLAPETGPSWKGYTPGTLPGESVG